jgi:hypothetical protein
MWKPQKTFYKWNFQINNKKDPVIEESCNATQQPQILDLSDEYAPQNLTQ